MPFYFHTFHTYNTTILSFLTEGGVVSRDRFTPIITHSYSMYIRYIHYSRIYYLLFTLP